MKTKYHLKQSEWDRQKEKEKRKLLKPGSLGILHLLMFTKAAKKTKELNDND